MKKNKFAIASGLFILLLFVLFVLVPGICLAADLPEIIMMSREQYRELVTIINRQENLLLKLQNTSTAQAANSTELKNLIEEQRLSYQKIRSELMLAQKSLSNSKKTIAEQNRSLQTLSKQIKHQQAVSKRKEIQTALWSGLAGYGLGRLMST